MEFYKKEFENHPNYDEEARKLFKKLNLPDPTEYSEKDKEDFRNWDDPDCVYIHP